MNSELLRPREFSRWEIGTISFIVSLPFVLLKASYINEVSSLRQFVTYGGLVCIIPLLVILWFICLCGEVSWRRRNLAGGLETPWFMILGCLFLLCFFHIDSAFHPLLKHFPSCQTVTQRVVWTTSSSTENEAAERFSLVLGGTGTRGDHQFEIGMLKWEGQGTAGIVSIELDPIRFQFGHYSDFVDGSLPLLRQRIRHAQIPKSEADAIAQDVWNVLNLANRKRAISAAKGAVSGRGYRLNSRRIALIGSFTWMAAVVLAFQVVGFKTLSCKRRERMD